jgi:cysteine desulfurase
MRQIYLDYAAATPMDPEVLKAMEPFFSERFYNPSAGYLAGRDSRRRLEYIRHKAAIVMGSRPAEIIFTAGATEANNLAIQGVMHQFPQAKVLTSAIEHESVLEPARLFAHREIPTDQNGLIILNKLSNLVDDETVLISVMLVNNEIGTIQPLKEIADLVENISKQRQAQGNKLPLYLHTDAAQAANYLDLHVSRLGIDMMSINGGKIYGPKQSGILYVKAGTKLKPLIIGGGQEFGLRSGTENIAAAAGLATALQTAQARRAAEVRRLTALRVELEKLLAAQLPASVINGYKNRAPHLISVTIPGSDNERLMMELDEAGIMCAVGSACSAGRDEASHVLTAIGLSEAVARSTLRFSLGRQTTMNEIKKVAGQLAKLAPK